jgi:hypothetical protein
MSKAFRWGWHWQTVAVPQAGPARVVVARGGGGGGGGGQHVLSCAVRLSLWTSWQQPRRSEYQVGAHCMWRVP